MVPSLSVTQENNSLAEEAGEKKEGAKLEAELAFEKAPFFGVFGERSERFDEDSAKEGGPFANLSESVNCSEIAFPPLVAVATPVGV